MKRIVGIDLGTTNTLLAWGDAEESARAPEVFPIEQLVSATEVAARPLFPSCLYAPLTGEVEGDPFGDAPWVAGEFARRRGAEVDGRLVASAKSWLCHAGVDRTAPILPWGNDDPEVPKISPLDASTRYLAHVAACYERAFPDAPLSSADIVLTVPASFDEGARELTLEAATRAGLTVRLLEEPQAAFYDCMRRIGHAGLGALVEGARDGAAHVLVCDVGGGTTDLSLIRVARAEEGSEPFAIARIATGHHLLLGGDNMDITLAHVCEERFRTQLEPARFAQLVGACRAAKERLLAADAPDHVTVTVLSRGSSLIGSSLSTELTREEVERIVLDGFFPLAMRDEKPSRKRSGLVAFGLPYERDVAITRHVAWFVARHVPPGTAIDAVLFNGGVFRAQRIADRVTESIAAWEGQEKAPVVLEHGDPDLGVARGAVAYGLALRGRGARIRGGAPHGYYVALADSARRAISIVPRGTQEEVPELATGVSLVLTVGRPVRFDLYASDDARVDPAGTIVTLDDEHFRPLPPAAVTFRAGDADVSELPVVLEGKLTAIGTLELACVESSPPEGREARRFRLAFQLRAPIKAPPSPTSIPPVSAGGKRLDEARQAIDRAFGKPRPDASARDIKDLMRELERILGERGSWTIQVARSLYDALIPFARSRRRSADHERVFWMLAGFCLRPGFGDPLDDGRIVRLTPLLAERLAFPEGPRGWQQFFIAWRRVAGGLDETVQSALRDTFDPFLAPSEAGLKKSKKFKPESLEDLRETLSSLERVPASRRADLGGWLLERTWTDSDPRLWTAVGRLGARVPTYASLHHVVSPAVVERWLDHLLRQKWENVPTAAQAAVELSRVTNDRGRDVSERVRALLIKRLSQISAKPEWIRAVREYVPVAEDDRAAFFGEGLPVGLRLADT
jgi:molecular chaperone DnaK (HSP70)